MNPAVEALFNHTRSRITENDIVDFSPNDPGYPDYVRLWTEIYRSGTIPLLAEFDLSEVIGLTGWANPDAFSEPNRFRAYRRFTTAVAVALVHYGNDCESVRVANYLARDLLIDLDDTSVEHLGLLRKVFPITRDALAATNHEEGYPFFTFGSMILAQLAGDREYARKAASQLIADESTVRQNESLNWIINDDRFLLGLSNFDQVHGDWISFAERLRNPTNDDNTELIIQCLAPTRR